MNTNRYWVGVGSAFLTGVIVGVAGIRVKLEKKLRAEFNEREVMLQRAYEKALDLAIAEKEFPVEDESQLTLHGTSDFDGETIINLDENLDQAILDFKLLDESLEENKTFGDGILTVGGEIEEVKDNPYHQAIKATETPHEMFVEGGVNDYGISYIEEEDYQDEDGRFKGKIDIIMDEHNPIFLMDGEPIDDWDKRVGDSILVDFYKLVPPGIDPVLYVRNHRTDEDYEVVRVAP